MADLSWAISAEDKNILAENYKYAKLSQAAYGIYTDIAVGDDKYQIKEIIRDIIGFTAVVYKENPQEKL